MTYLASGAALWVGRAHNAWGQSRQWGVGTSFEQDLATMTTDRNTWHTRADQAWGDSRVWSSGTSFESDRNYWRDTVAHGDPNVWTNRYNTGYTDGAASKTTIHQSAACTGPAQATPASGWVQCASITASIAGNAMAAGYCMVQRHNTNAGDFTCYARIKVAGGVVWDGQAQGIRTNCGADTPDPTVAVWQGSVGAGQVVTMEVLAQAVPGGNSADFNHGGTFYLTEGSV